MPGRGRPPKPTRLKLITGDAGKRTQGKKPPAKMTAAQKAVAVIDRKPPTYLNAEGKEEWTRVVAILIDQRKFHNHMRSNLATYCEAYQTFRWALRELAHGKKQYANMITKTPNGYPVMHPALTIKNKAMEQMRLIGNEFGLSVLAAIRAQQAQLDLFDDAGAPPAGGDQQAAAAGDAWSDF